MRIFSKTKNKVSQLFSKSKPSEEEERLLVFLKPWVVLEIVDPHELNQEDEKTAE